MADEHNLEISKGMEGAGKGEIGVKKGGKSDLGSLDDRLSNLKQ